MENRGANEFRAAPSELAASAFRFDQSERAASGAFFALGLEPNGAPEVIRTQNAQNLTRKNAKIIKEKWTVNPLVT